MERNEILYPNKEQLETKSVRFREKGVMLSAKYGRLEKNRVCSQLMRLVEQCLYPKCQPLAPSELQRATKGQLCCPFHKSSG